MKTTSILTGFALAALAAFTNSAPAAQGDLDLTFGGTGKVTTSIGNQESDAKGVAIDSEGRIVVAGRSVNNDNADFAVVRYTTDGSLDTTFNGTGKVTTEMGGSFDCASSVVIQSDGKILVAGQTEGASGRSVFAVARYNGDGSLDTTLSGTGKLTTAVGFGSYGISIALQTDGKFVVAGHSAAEGGPMGFAIVRYNANGSLDTTFNGTGKAVTNIATQDICRSLAIQTDGKILVVGDVFDSSNYVGIALVRFNADGSLDTSFNGDGHVMILGASGSSMVLQHDGKIVVATGNTLLRYNPTGSLDTSFNGVLTPGDGTSSVAVQKDGKLLVGGRSGGDFLIERHNIDGSLDIIFHGSGKVTTDFGGSDVCVSVAIGSDWKIVLAGYSDFGGRERFAVARYEGEPDTDGDGIPDIFETGTGIYISPMDTGTDPNKADTDGDGLSDGDEVYKYHTNPNLVDTDGDGFSDGFEVATGFDPNSAASTPDAQSSIRTAAEYRFNAANGISYRIEASTDLNLWTTIETPIIGNGGFITRFYSIEGQPKRFFRSRRN